MNPLKSAVSFGRKTKIVLLQKRLSVDGIDTQGRSGLLVRDCANMPNTRASHTEKKWCTCWAQQYRAVYCMRRWTRVWRWRRYASYEHLSPFVDCGENRAIAANREPSKVDHDHPGKGHTHSCKPTATCRRQHDEHLTVVSGNIETREQYVKTTDTRTDLCRLYCSVDGILLLHRLLILLGQVHRGISGGSLAGGGSGGGSSRRGGGIFLFRHLTKESRERQCEGSGRSKASTQSV